MHSDNTQSDYGSPPKTSNSYVLVFGGIMLIGLLFLAWLGRPERLEIVGVALPQLDLVPLVHADAPIENTDLHGKISVLHFWGTWCPPCQREFPEFARLTSEFAGNDSVAIVSVSCSGGPEYDLNDLRNQTEVFLADYEVAIPTYADPAAMTRQQLSMLMNGSFGYPTTVVVDQEGKILEALDGYYPGEMEKLVATIKSHL